MGLLRVLPLVLFMGVSALAQSRTYGVGSVRGISRSALPGRNSRQDMELPRRARRSIARSARYAMGRRVSRAERPF